MKLMLPPTEPVKTEDRRTAPEIINSIQRRLQQGGNLNTSAIIEDIWVVDRLAQQTHPVGIFGFPVVSEYFQAIGRHVPEVRDALQIRESTATSEASRRQLDRLKEIIIPTPSQRYNHLRQNLYGPEKAEPLDKTAHPLLDDEARKTTGVGVDPKKSVFGILLANLQSHDGYTSTVVPSDKPLPKERALTREVSSLIDTGITTEKAKVLGRAIELLAEGNTSQELVNQLMLGLRIYHHYKDRYNYEKGEAIFLFQLPKEFQDSHKETLRLDTNLPGLIRTLNVLQETLSDIGNMESNPLLADIVTSLRETAQSPLFQEINRLIQNPNLREAPPPLPGSYFWLLTDKQKTAGITKLELRGGQTEIARGLIEAATGNLEDCQKLENTTIKLLSLLYLAHFQRQMKSRLPDIAPTESSQDLEVVEARNLHRLLLSGILRGKPLSQVTLGDIKSFLQGREEGSLPATPEDFESIPLGRQIPWPTDFSPQDSLSYLSGLTKAIEVERPVSLKFMTDKPIIILTGPNGSGKSSAENTLANSLALAAVTRTNPSAKVVKLSELMTNIRRSDPAVSTNVTSTFQSEAIFLAEALNKLGKGDILFLDEVGRGTDSRDAASLGQGIETYCIENSINLVVASHYGPQLLELSDKFGIRNFVRVLRVDPETRQLVETDYAGKSMGVEVFRQRAKDKIPAGILEPLIQNALAIRQASLSGEIPELVSFPSIAETGHAMTYADDASLEDMNIYGNILGTILRFTTDQIPTTPDRRNAWRLKFLTIAKATTNIKSETDLRPIHTLIDALVKTIPSEGLATFTLNSTRSFEAVSALYPTKGLETLTPDQPHDFLQVADEFFRFYDTPERRQRTFDYMANLSGQLINTGNSNLVQLGNSMRAFTEQTRQRLNSTLEPLERSKPDQQALMAQFSQQAAQAIRRHTTSYPQFTEEHVNSLRVSLGETQSNFSRITSRSNPAKFFEDLAKRIESGDQKAYGAFSYWALHTSGLPSGLTDSSGLRTLTNLAWVIGSKENQSMIVNSGELSSNSPSNINLSDFIMKSFYSGDLGPLFKVVRIVANIDREATVYQRNQPVMELVKTIKLLESERALAGMKSVAEFKPLSVPVSNMAYYTTMLNTIRQLSWGKVAYDNSGNVEVKNGQPLALLATKKISAIARQSFVIPAEADATVAVGLNGGGKTQLLMLMAGVFYWDKLTGYGPGEAVKLPQNRPEFLACMVNSGQSTEAKSSAQNEFDRQIDFLSRYLEAGTPTNGYVFFDEPGASTSSEDQIGVLGALINFYQSHDVKVIFTNHNHNTYDILRKLNINFSAIGFLRQNGRATYQPTAYNPDEIENVPSEGINVAEEFGLDNKIIQVARLARQIIDESSQPAA